MKPQGGPDDWRALFHEAGHTEHFAHTYASLSPEEKRLGDNAVTEGWAMLLEHLTTDPVWLERRLDFPRPLRVRRRGSRAAPLARPPLLREAPLRARVPLGRGSDRAAAAVRGAALRRDEGRAGATDYLSDIDEGFYATEYLRAWAFEAQLRAYLRERFGNAWFSRREAGSLLRELWAEGQKPTADELLREVTGETLELAAVGDRVREALAAV